MKIHTKLFLCLLAFSFILQSCKKDKGIGANLLPDEDNLNFIFDDTTELLVQTVKEVPLRTDRMLYNYLGHLESSFFGKSEASTTIEIVRPTTYPSDSLAPYTLKSVELNLIYDNHYGDTTVPAGIEVFKINSSINKEIVYTSDYSFSFSNLKIGSLSNYFFKPNVPIKLNDKDTSIGTNGLLKIPMDNFFGYSLINQMSSNTFDKDSLFRIFLPGIKLAMNQGNKGKTMIQFDLSDAKNGIYLYLTDKKGKDTTVFFPIAASTFYHTNFEKNYNGSLVETAINSPEAGNETLYIQSQSGLKTWVRFLNTDRFKGTLINKAVIEVIETIKSDNNTPRPRTLFPLKRNEDGSFTSILDYSSSFYGPAALDTSKKREDGTIIAKYNINISDYFQDFVSGKKDTFGLYLTNYPLFSQTPGFVLTTGSVVLSNYVEPSTLIFGGPKNSDVNRRMKLKVWYTLPK